MNKWRTEKNKKEEKNNNKKVSNSESILANYWTENKGLEVVLAAVTVI